MQRSPAGSRFPFPPWILSQLPEVMDVEHMLLHNIRALPEWRALEQLQCTHSDRAGLLLYEFGVMVMSPAISELVCVGMEALAKALLYGGMQDAWLVACQNVLATLLYDMRWQSSILSVRLNCLTTFSRQDEQSRWWLEKEEPRLVALGAISRVDPSRVVDHVVNAFCVPKPDGGNWCLVVNLKRMNIVQKAYKCRESRESKGSRFPECKQKLAKLRRLAIGLRITAKKNRRLVQKREPAKFCGFAQSVKLALTPAPLFLRNSYDDVKQPVGRSSAGAVLAWAQSHSTRAASVALPRYSLDLQSVAAPPVITNLLVSQLQLVAPSLDHSARPLQIAQVVMSRVGAKPWQSYASHFAAFVRFYVEEGLEFLPASHYAGLLWGQFLAAKGSIQAHTAQPYFSAINSVHDLLGYPKPCAGDSTLLAALSRGWERLQRSMAPASTLLLAFSAGDAWRLYEQLAVVPWAIRQRFLRDPSRLWLAGQSTRGAERWFDLVLAGCGLPHLRGLHSLYSLRRGGASAARAVEVLFEVVEAFGDGRGAVLALCPVRSGPPVLVLSRDEPPTV
ncbi:hypothetical protein VOLCADRAFT_88909 [Volvox carteri f. nagariensis]|uniref:Uncharacterized protein n=1 Tax=Volvox carteri f. nagariensis TaxID=3068 RepID=D8TQA1_VOLCA|nr:uncharacterized protein VOLCADRAFT_88909 [Volvox carteri f. nagariensis]EFJ50369.1 hypothetical protein VOLCADRAFT_88909 [Volvox carteri f. nagariensis]|eukprot:XP_002948494.1 hypothetical protein VOLCADRAFT_88909 [Volvox carteri f. nagariensis]